MKVKCFACEVEIEAGDLDGCEAAFVEHGLESHRWTYPEQALRTYATQWLSILH